MEITFFSPFKTVYAKLKLTDHKGEWMDENGKADLQTMPIYSRWFTPDWNREIAFLFGKILPESRLFTWINAQHHPAEWKKSDRKIRCEYSAEKAFPEACLLETPDLRVEVDFTSVDCENGL